MISDTHKIELYIDNEMIEFDKGGLGIKLSNTLIQPTKLTASTVTYSYSFNVPATPRNNRILGNVNVAEKKNKFNRRYRAVLYADSIEIFNGNAKIASYSDGKYKMNLYVNRLNTIDSIFGDDTMGQVDWKVPFRGNQTINEVNRDLSTKYFFPYVAYALPMKKPYNTTGSGVEYYTDKKTLDKYTKFYYNTFVPSLNLVELVRRCFEHKGLTLQGDILTDDVLGAIYLSNYIKDDQDPAYNLGSDDIGEMKFSISFSNNYMTSASTPSIIYDNAVEWKLDEDFLPKNARNISGSWYGGLDNFTGNWDTFYAYNLLDRNDLEKYKDKVFMLGKSEIQHGALDIDLQNNGAKQNIGDGAITIPQDGWYEITVDGFTGIDERDGIIGGTALNTNSWRDVIHQDDDGNIEREARAYKINQWTQEFQLLRYRPDSDSDENSISHNPLWGGEYPNEEGGTIFYMNGTYSRKRDDNATTAMCDPYNNPNYICGWMYSKEGAQLGYIKNGGSWNAETFDKNEAIYNCSGYYRFDASNLSGYTGSISYVGDYPQTDFDENKMQGYTAFNEISLNGREINGKLRCIVKLKRNDILIPYLNTHALIDGETYGKANEKYVTYRAYAKLNFNIRPVAEAKVPSRDLSYGMETRWDSQLNLANFLNSEQKMSEFITNVQKAFNLSFERNGDTCVMNLNKLDTRATSPIDLDSRYNVSRAEFGAIEWASDIKVGFSVNEEEEGFYRSVPDDHINDDDWKEYGDKGSVSLPLSMVDDATTLEMNVPFSYCWYNDFKVMDFGAYRRMGTETFYNKRIPVIGKSEWWIEGYDYAQMRQHDGRGLRQRLWFRERAETALLLPSNGYAKAGGGDGLIIDLVYFCTPVGTQIINGERYYLDYKYGDNTLLGRYFNVDYDSREDMVTVETLITPDEYRLIGKGCSVKLNDDLYRVMRVTSYNPETGKAKMELLGL